MKGHLIAAGVWLGLIAAGYAAFDHFGRAAPEVTGCDGPGGSGEVVVAASRDGHFYLDGAVNGEPVRFLVDTGASYVSVDAEVARRAGVTGQTPALFNTAAGQVRGSVGRAQRVSAACLVVPDLSVAINPGLGGTALLGQNFLRRFEVVQTRHELRLRAR